MKSVPRRGGIRCQLRLEPLEGRELLSAAGTLDSGFGGGTGATTVPLEVPVLPAFITSADSVISLPSGGVLVVGTVSINTGSGVVEPALASPAVNPIQNSAELVLSEIQASGAINTGFGQNGQVQIPIASGQTFAEAVEPNGQIVLASTTRNASGVSSYLAVRLNADGSLDPSFGSAGIAEYPSRTTTPVADRIGQVASVLVDPSGKILLAGSSAGGFTAVRLNSDGSLDTTYGEAGTATVPVTVGNADEDLDAGAVLMSNGELILAGDVGGAVHLVSGVFIPAEIAVVELEESGSLDPYYGAPSGGGIALIPPVSAGPTIPSLNTATAVVEQPTTGDILVAGYDEPTAGTTPASFDAVYRLTPTGTIDPTFGTAGLAESNPNGDGGPVGLAAQSNGDILLTSTVNNLEPSPGATLGLVQLNPDGSPVAGFGNSAIPGLFLSRLKASTTPVNPAILPANGDVLLVGTGTLTSPGGLTGSLNVDSVLPVSTAAPASLPQVTPTSDFQGLGYSDAAVYDQSNATFYYQSALPTTTAGQIFDFNQVAFGIAGYGQTLPAADDYQGVGYDQYAAYLSTAGVYAILPTATSPGLFLKFGVAGFGGSIPVPADYFGTGQADVAVYMPSQGAFAILKPGNTSGEIVSFGPAGVGQSIPAPADYYGTGQADLAVYLQAAGAFAIQDPSGKTSGELIPFGKAGYGQSIPVPGDYDGSGKVELAVYVPSQGAYDYRSAKGAGDVEIKIGTANSGDVPVPGDYDGSGLTEAAVYDPTTGSIEYQPANGGPVVTIRVGMPTVATPTNGMIPVAEPSGALPEFNPIAIPAITTPVVPAAVATVTPAVTSHRVALSLVTQASQDPLNHSS